jgi:parallel beta-helix repeat protein
MHRFLPWMLLLALAHAAPAAAQISATLSGVEAYGNLETAGVIATLAGDTDRDATLTVEWRRNGESGFRLAHPGVRFDATHFASSLFALSAGTAHDVRVTLSDPNGVGGTAIATATFSTRVDALVEPSLRTIHVATGGDDGDDGLTPATAVATIQRGAQLAQAGDVVSIAPGLYRESVDLPRSGTATQPIVFRGAGDGVILDGADAALATTGVVPGQGWTALGNGVFAIVLGFDTGHVVSESGRLFRYDSQAELQALAAGAPGGFRFDGTQLTVKFPDGSSPLTHTLHAARHEHGILADGIAHVRIENLTIRHYGAGDFGKGIYLRYSDDVIVRANRIHENGAAGVWIKGGARHRIEDNIIHDTSIPSWPWDQTKGSSAEDTGIVLTDDPGRGHVIRRNTLYGLFNGIGPCGSAAPPAGFTTEVDVYRNDLRFHTDDALEPEGYCANLRIFENRIRDVHMAFAIAPAAPGPTFILRNIAHDTGSTRTSQLDGYVSSALKINSGFAAPIGPVLLYHNTIHTRAAATDAISLLNPGNSTVIRSRNNVFSGTRYVLEKVNPVLLDLDYDLLHSTDPTRFVRWMGTSHSDLAALIANRSQEIHGVQDDPGLEAPASGDFRPRPGSAVLDRGVALPGINDGWFGAAPDMGAIEGGDHVFRDGFETR